MLHTNRHRVRGHHTPRHAAGSCAIALRLAAPAAAAALLLRSMVAGAAPYLPGPDADPPTGATGQAEVVQSAIAGNGIQWVLAPLQIAGTVSVDGRWLRLEDRIRSTQSVLFNDIEAATHVWQPWFIQLRAGLGALADHDVSGGQGTRRAASNSVALTGRFSVAVFPASRFPFELRAEVNDSRVRGDTLGTDYRSHRLSLSQSYRPESGNDSYSVNLEHSRLSASDDTQDTVTSLRGSALREFPEHTFELSGQLTRNDRTESDERSRFTTVSARHTFHPASSLHVDTLANWNDVQLHSGSAAGGFDGSTEMRQVSSFATWRPREGEWLHSANSPLYLSGSLRVIDARTDGDTLEQRLRAFNASLGVSQELTREWRLAGAVSGTVLEPDGAARTKSATGNASVNYTPAGPSLGEWRYSPTLGANLGVSRSSEAGQRNTLALQVSHGLSRGYTNGQGESISVNLTQSVGALRDSQLRHWSRALAHSVGLYWQGAGDGASQSYGGLSLSDSRTWEQESGSFQLANLQFSRRTQLSRHASWSGNLTLQASRSASTQVDAFSGAQRRTEPGWQRYYSGSLSYENQRVFDVPRLRYSALLALNSQQLERRAEGDIDAPRERITESLENRLDYSIGRLEARLSARVARVDGRSVASVFVRLQRRY